MIQGKWSSNQGLFRKEIKSGKDPFDYAIRSVNVVGSDVIKNGPEISSLSYSRERAL